MKATRRIHAYCVGQAKSGTASLWGICRTNLRSAHEPELPDVLAKVQAYYSNGAVTDDEVIQWLMERDQRLQLDVDIGWNNYFLLNHLLVAFPSAKYIILVRDCYTWMASVIGHMLTRQIPTDARQFMEFWFKISEHPHSEGEELLLGRGLFSLDSYLLTWHEHITRCVSMIPEDPRIVIRTHELSNSLPVLANFLEVDCETLDTESDHINVGTWRGQIEKFIRKEVVERAVKRVDSDSMGRYFPEVRDINDAYALQD